LNEEVGLMHTLPELPYGYNALEPYIDEQTMKIHHDKHFQTYADKLNAALEKYPELQKKKAEELIKNLDKFPFPHRDFPKKFNYSKHIGYN